MEKYQHNLTANSSGALRPLSGASVTVTDKATGLPAALFEDDELTPIPQPLTTDNTGYFGFKAADGKYTLTFSGPRFATFTRQILLEDPDDNPAVTAQELALPSAAERIGYGGRKVSDKLGEVVSALDFGALGTSDDTTTIQAAIDAVAAAGGGTVLLPWSGSVVVSGLVLKDFVTLEGRGKNVTVIKLKNGANAHVIQAGDFDANADGISRATPVGCKTGGLRKLTLDGNKANQTAAKHGLAYYGIDLQLEDVEFKNGKGIGLYSECPGGTYSAVVGQNLQTSIRNIECHDNDLGNLRYNGQSDSVLVDVMCYTAGNGAGQYNTWFGTKAAGAKVFGMHCWGASDYAVVSEAGLIEFTGCHAESAAVAKVWAKQPIIWNGGRVYEVGANTSAVGFKLEKDYNQIRGVTATNINGGLIDTSVGGAAGANSIIEVFGYTSTAGATLYVGSMPTTSVLSLRLFGSTASSLLQTVGKQVARGGFDMASSGIDRANFIAGQGWAAGTIDSGNLPVATSHVVIGPGSAVDITDITSTAGEQGILQVTIRNGGAGAATFKHNVSKLRNNGLADKVLNQYESITYTRVSGSVWQQTAGK